jgi:hypothetical protein
LREAWIGVAAGAVSNKNVVGTGGTTSLAMGLPANVSVMLSRWAIATSLRDGIFRTCDIWIRRPTTGPTEETDDPLYADRRNFYKVKKWTKHGQRIEGLLVGGNSLDNR